VKSELLADGDPDKQTAGIVGRWAFMPRPASEAERLGGRTFTTRDRCLTLMSGVRIFCRSADGVANLVHGLTQGADGMETDGHGTGPLLFAHTSFQALISSWLNHLCNAQFDGADMRQMQGDPAVWAGEAFQARKSEKIVAGRAIRPAWPA
jgi:hypothetical protein